jgi:hypothetical protein
MSEEYAFEKFLANYDEKVFNLAIELRKLLLKNLPGITEQLDLPAKMVAYCYGQKYSELICVMLPSKKGLKLGFNRGPELPDPQRILEGTAKTTRYVDIKSEQILKSTALKGLIKEALKAHKLRST